MSYATLTPDLIEKIHDALLAPGDLPGRARDTSLEGALARVDNRLVFGLINDVFDLAAAYATAIAQSRCFDDHQRTAHQVMDVCLDLNGVQINWNATEIGPVLRRAAQRLLDEGELAEWLRQRP